MDKAALTDICNELAEGKSLPSIYGLYDSRGKIRYIGKANNPSDRLKGHMRDMHRRDTPLYRWLRKNGQPTMRILEAECRDWREAERRLIAKARECGEKLLNVADGGDEPHCPISVRAKNGAATAKAIQSNPSRKRLWQIKLQLGRALKDGVVMNSTRQKMRLLAAKVPSIFGEWALIPDRDEAYAGH